MADSLDVLAIGEAKKILGRSLVDSSKDDTIERLITATSRRLDRLIGPVITRTVTSEVVYPHSCHLELAYGPVSSISSVVEYQGSTAVTVTAETPGTEPTEGYLPERYAPQPSLLSGILVRRSGGNTANWWPGAVVVTYTAGRVASTTQVDARHKEAAALILKNLWRSYEVSTGGVDEYDVPTQSFPTFAVPNSVKELLADEIQTADGFG